MPGLGYILSDYSLLWTKRGLLHASELNENDEIFGVQNDIGIWTKIDNITELEKKIDAFRLCLNSVELLILSNSRIGTLTGYKDIKNINENDKVYVCNKNNIMNQIYRDLKDNRFSMKYFYKGNECELIIGSIVNYIIGRYFLYDLSKSNYKIRIKFDDAKEVQSIYYKIRSIFYPIRNEIRAVINWRRNVIIFESVFFEKIMKRVLIKNSVPIEVRSTSLNSIQSFFLGLLENDQCDLFKIERNNVKMITKNTESKIRGVLITYLNTFGLIPNKIKYQNYETHIYYDRIKFIDLFNKKILFDSTIKSYKTFEETYQDVKKILHYRVNKTIILKLPDELINYNLMNGNILMKPINIDRYVE